ncbi:YibE/F family protein [Orenia marismortui]|uniref:Putative membrane protein n=1 Tax=Orenia marismortui TaxID=46469 RepID=A0A4R8HAI8_9FIRM|nr:YibE/F family protein [Orenia marismortui]TDX52945.1 putative membrane protein [Orenia marismortui]
MKTFKIKKAVIILALILIISIFINNFMADSNDSISEIKALVHKVDNSEVIRSGLTSIGYQTLDVAVLEGKYQGEVLEATNQFTGSAEIDNSFQKGDKILIAIKEKNGNINAVKAIDLYRQNWELILFLLFVLLLILYAGFTGVKALFSFLASLYVIWRVLIPGLLNGKDPLLLSTFVITILSAIIMFSIAGFSKKGVAALVGTLSGLFITMGITIFFGGKLGLHGMTSPFSQTLLFSGHMDLKIKDIFYASIIIGASGAAMDIAMDIAASMEELKIKRPDMGMIELIQSGFNIGRSVIGTMTTTLLLAYSGGYLTLLMLFMTKNASLSRMMNFKMVSAEILRTVTGSIGLVLVAPITAIIAGWLYTYDFKQFSKK